MDLSGVSTADLERLADGIRAGRLAFPLSSLALDDEGLGAFKGVLDDLNAAGRTATLAVCDTVVTDRRAAPPPPDLVWTGPEARHSGARDTRAVLSELLSRAQTSILLAGFAFDHSEQVLKPLHEAMVGGVSVRLFADSEVAEEFLRMHWPFGPPLPDVYTFRASAKEFASLHAKCVVVDHRKVLITSANFTDRGQTRNVEVGVVIEDPRLAEVLEAQFVGGEWFQRVVPE